MSPKRKSSCLLKEAVCPMFRKCAARVATHDPAALAENLRQLGVSFVALQNGKGTIGSTVDFSGFTCSEGVHFTSDCGLLIHLNRLLFDCSSLSCSFDFPALEFSCACSSSRMLIYPRKTLHSVAAVASLTALFGQGSGTPPAETITGDTWLNEFPDDSEASLQLSKIPRSEGGRIHVEMDSGYARWRKSIDVSIVDRNPPALIVRSTSDVLYLKSDRLPSNVDDFLLYPS